MIPCLIVHELPGACRSRAIENLLIEFCKHAQSAAQPFQIVSLGAGFDTTFFRLQGQGLAPTCFYELDFPELLSRKASCILADEGMCAAVGPLLQTVRAEPPEQQAPAPSTTGTDTRVAKDVPTQANAPKEELRELRSATYAMVGVDLTDLPHVADSLRAAGARPVRSF